MEEREEEKREKWRTIPDISGWLLLPLSALGANPPSIPPFLNFAPSLPLSRRRPFLLLFFCRDAFPPASNIFLLLLREKEGGRGSFEAPKSITTLNSRERRRRSPFSFLPSRISQQI